KVIQSARNQVIALVRMEGELFDTALAVAAKHAFEEDRLAVLEEALLAIPLLDRDFYQAARLISLSDYLLEPQLRHALELASTISDTYYAAEAQAGLLPRLAELGYSQEALALTERIGRQNWQ